MADLSVLALAGLVVAGCSGPPADTAARASAAAPAPSSVAAEPVAASVPSVEGSVWAGTDDTGDELTFRFKAGGALGFTSPAGTYDNRPGLTWSQTGDVVTMSTGYATFDGRIEGITMSGTGKNSYGAAWTWTATRQ